MTAAHTPGPWARIDSTTVVAAHGAFVAETATTANNHAASENAARIVACVNACEGHDPAEIRRWLDRWGPDYAKGDELARLRAENERLRAALERIAADMPEPEPEPEDYDDMESAYANGYECAAWDLGKIARAALGGAA